ncbi:ATP-dependent helicase [Ruminococcus sp. 5_1_39BFAA]|uniref:ATP-dependent helicase n=1 Tax=Ruminococcus sp. 5_1_39BFAA TaxID=457412 RepID=UPI00356A19CD
MKKNPSQLRAIAHLSGPMMVLAGPGSGKTSVVVERTAYLIREGKIPASSILVVTFSKAAAREMKERFLRFMEIPRSDVTFGTFHGVFYGILKQAYGLGAGNILSEEEKYGILKELTMEYGQDMAQEGDFLEEVAKEISVVKGNRISLEHYYASCCSDEVFRRIFMGYRNALRQKRKLDFDDMLLCCYQLLSQRQDIRQAWQQKFRYIMVDEFQDINHLQYDTVRLLAAPENNLFIVGDDDQSIYHFRGARPEIMLNFKKVYSEAETVLLDVNYRCSENILSTAMKVVSCNQKRFSKKLSTPNEKGKPVCLREFQNPREEYLAVSAKLKQRLEAGENLEDTVILFRTNQEAEGLVGTLMEYQIPFTMKEQLPNLFRHWICRNLRAYLAMAAGDRSRRTFLEIMNRPNRYIARDALTEPQIRFEALQEYYKDKDWMCDRITTLETHLKILATLNPYAAINFIRKGMGYEEYLREYADYRRMKPEELLEVLERIQESAKGMKSLSEWEEYIEAYTKKLAEQAKKQEVKREGVTLSTLHASKGLEYDRVYIMNVNEGSIPYKKAVLQEALEEERRLFYVGMTRAKKELTLCYVKRQFEKERDPSRFLEEAGLLNREKKSGKPIL